ncbi:MAG: proteasome accessory factor PafA2 family protein [Pirellulaceae bacterium]
MVPIFQRLAGLETEYAIRFQSPPAPGAAPSRFRQFESIVAVLRRQIPTVPARYFKEGVFTANGGAVWFEAERPSAGGGLIEGATPECRGPRQLVTYQMAQDRTLADCAQQSRHDLALIKNDRDAQDNIYGAQENYEAVLASGWRLAAWRLGLVLLFPLAVITWVSILGCVLVTLAYFLVAGLFYIPLRFLTGRHERLTLYLFGRDISEGRETCVHLPVWLEASLQAITRLLTGPLAVSLYWLLRSTAFAHIHARLLPFLVSRAVLGGAGMIDAKGQFQLADKGPAINCTYGFGGILWDRPIYTFGHFFKAIYAESWFSPREYAALFSAQQRLQIGIGDSNMCPTAQYLRVGTTLLVLDAIDAGFFGYHPRLKSPIRALRAICGDPTLQVKVPLRGEPPATALQLQRFYLSACRVFVGSQPQAPREAHEVLDLWKRALDELEMLAQGESTPKWLVGTVDWVTKRYLMDHAAPDLTWSERKKIDIRYHELTDDGYFALLRSAGLVPEVVQEDAILRAQRLPPADTPATTRGHYIREFASGDEPLTVNWKSVVLGRGWSARTVRLNLYGRRLASPARVRAPHRDGRSERNRRRKKG